MNDPDPMERPIRRSSVEHDDELLRSVEDAMKGLDYGTILITVHAAKAVQLEVTRKQRFAK